MFPLLTRAYSEGALTLVLPNFWLLLHMHYLVFTHHRLSIYLYAPARIFSVPTFPAYLFGQPFCEPPSHCLSLTQASVPCGHGFFSWQPPLPCRCSVLEAPWCSGMPEHQEWTWLSSSHCCFIAGRRFFRIYMAKMKWWKVEVGQLIYIQLIQRLGAPLPL